MPHSINNIKQYILVKGMQSVYHDYKFNLKNYIKTSMPQSTKLANCHLFGSMGLSPTVPRSTGH